MIKEISGFKFTKFGLTMAIQRGVLIVSITCPKIKSIADPLNFA